MKSSSYILVTFLIALNAFSCSKENETNDSVNDSIPLFYQKLDSDTTLIKMPDGSTIYYETYKVTFYAGPHPYERTNTVINTSDTSMRVCCGKNYYDADLDVDSLINKNLYWTYNVYISYNFTLTDYIFLNPKYIGLRIRNGNIIKYGWVHCNNNRFVEYAVDTSSINTGEVKAGRKYKHL
jgi:hypothetical protein